MMEISLGTHPGTIRLEKFHTKTVLIPSFLKLRIHECAEWFVNCSRTIRKPNARMCGWNCESAQPHLWIVRILSTTNWNLLDFCVNTKRTGCAGCPFHAPGILYSPQVRRKLINRASLTSHKRTAQHVSRFYA